MLTRRFASSLGIDYRPLNEGVSMKLPAIGARICARSYRILR
jgi:hypothetical protein